ncbi:MAG: sodium:solute symporter, partial [Clostridia bacterium]|nr:sodium:solute symporter [Clostridia bacterium]
MVVKIACILVFAAVTVLIGILSSKKVRGVGDFVLGGRNVGPWFSAFAFGTSYFSAVIFVGYAGRFGWNFGVSAAWIGLANALIGSCLAWLVLGRRTRVMTKHLNTSTMPEFFEKRYDSKALKLVAALIIFVFLVPYSASIYKGLSGIFQMAFNIPFEYCIIGMAVLTAVYVILGGYVAAALNDFIQGIVMLIGISIVVYKVMAGQGG